MANVNINRTTTDTNDNVRYSYNTRNGTDYKGITLLIGGTLTIFTCIWLIALAIASVGCWITHTYECKEVTYIFWGYIIILTSLCVIALSFSIPALHYYIGNIKFLQWRGIITHRDDLRSSNVAKVIAVAQTSAKSEATAGMDNYSPSITHTQKASENVPIDIPLSELTIAPIDESELL